MTKKADHYAPSYLACTDKLVSGQPGIVPLLSGTLTTSRTWECNVFIDACSEHGFGFMMRNTTLDQTFQTK